MSIINHTLIESRLIASRLIESRPVFFRDCLEDCLVLKRMSPALVTPALVTHVLITLNLISPIKVAIRWLAGKSPACLLRKLMI